MRLRWDSHETQTGLAWDSHGTHFDEDLNFCYFSPYQATISGEK